MRCENCGCEKPEPKDEFSNDAGLDFPLNKFFKTIILNESPLPLRNMTKAERRTNPIINKMINDRLTANRMYKLNIKGKPSSGMSGAALNIATNFYSVIATSELGKRERLFSIAKTLQELGKELQAIK